MSINKIKQFMLDHKAELITATVAASGIVLVILGAKRHPKKLATKSKDVPIPASFKIWDTSMLWHEGAFLNAIIEKIPIEDLGALGEEYVRNGLAKPGEFASVIIGVKKK